MATFMKNINLISQSGALYRDMRLADLGVNGWQTKYILAVCGEEGLSQDALARQLFVNKSNVARQMSQLEELGFVRREQSEKDKRVINVYSTPKGREAYLIIKQVNADWRELITEGFSDEERDELFKLTDKLYKNACTVMGREQ